MFFSQGDFRQLCTDISDKDIDGIVMGKGQVTQVTGMAFNIICIGSV